MIRSSSQMDSSAQELFVLMAVPDLHASGDLLEKFKNALNAHLPMVSLGNADSPIVVSNAGASTEACGIRIEVVQLFAALMLLRQELFRLNAPIGTTLSYTSDGMHLQDVLRSEGWDLQQPPPVPANRRTEQR